MAVLKTVSNGNFTFSCSILSVVGKDFLQSIGAALGISHPSLERFVCVW